MGLLKLIRDQDREIDLTIQLPNPIMCAIVFVVTRINFWVFKLSTNVKSYSQDLAPRCERGSGRGEDGIT